MLELERTGMEEKAQADVERMGRTLERHLRALPGRERHNESIGPTAKDVLPRTNIPPNCGR
jgi:hypothetical protein